VLQKENIYRGGELLASNDSGGWKYLMTDHQGSTRVVMSGSSIVARHDYLPFGEEVGAGTGLRTSTQGYATGNPILSKYAGTERDSNGLDHTWWRKLESTSGRWTSPDPYKGSMSIGDPQSFNRYSYVENDPATAIELQQAFSGISSTISRKDAGIIDFNSPDYQRFKTLNPSAAAQYENSPVSQAFDNDTTKATTVIAPGDRIGATIADRSNVFYSGVGLAPVLFSMRLCTL
jgi:RHS repeat-associated protein